jgi:hypothetical protein
MEVGAAEPERRQRAAPGPVRIPAAAAGVDEERRPAETAARIGVFDMQRGGDLAVAEGERQFDGSRGGRRGIEMADVRLDAADRAVAGVGGVGPPRLGDGGHLDRVAERCPGAVRLEHPDAAGRHPGPVQGGAHRRALTRRARGGEAGPVRPVVVERGGQDHRVDGVTLVDCVLQSAQHQAGAAAGEDHAGGRGVEGAHPAVGRQRAVGHMGIAKRRGPAWLPARRGRD